MLHAGNFVQGSATTPLVLVNQVQPTQVRFAINAQNLPLIVKYGGAGGLPVLAVPGGTPPTAPSDSSGATGLTPASAETTPIAAAVSASQQQGESGPPQRGLLATFDNAIDTTTQTVQMKATFPNTGNVLWPGQYDQVTIEVYIERDALVVPVQAVVTGQRGQYVYVVDSASKAQQRTVVVERSVNGIAVITAGLNEGDKVVTDGQSRLTQGATVTLRTSASTDSTGARGGRGSRGATGTSGRGSGARGKKGDSTAAGSRGRKSGGA
jgi:multidrug efflux system membrane fusion protein